MKLESNDVKLVLKDVPEAVEEYRRWRYYTTASIVAAAPDPVKAMPWVLIIQAEKTKREDLITADNDPLKRVDVKLFCVLLGALKGGLVAKFSMQIEAEAEMFNGRQALWIVDKGML